ncbi:MAG TPA: Yip1 family protein [Usitatibacter sp.]|nr:Yip1 family protein [Usitatibacter sp.]
MRLIDRAKNILLNPKAEWDAIAADPTPTAQMITGYVLPLAALAALASFIGLSLVGQSLPFLGTYRMGIGWGLGLAIYNVVMAVVFVYVVGFIIDALAPTFNAQKNMPQALKLAAYSYTPVWVLGLLAILPALGVLGIIGALYGLYLLYLGLPRLMKNPPDKSVGYTALTVVCAIVVGFIISIIGGLITAPAMMAAGTMGSSGVTFDKDSPAGKLDEFARKMEEAGKKMEAAQKSGDAGKQMEAAMGALGTALSGGKGVEPVQLDTLKPFLPEKFAGLPRTDMRADRSGVAGLMAAKVEGTFSEGDKEVELEIVDTGGAAGLTALAGWAALGATAESETADRVERLKREGNRVVREEISKRGGTHQYSVILADRYVVSAEGRGVDIGALKSAVNGLDLARIESLK